MIALGPPQKQKANTQFSLVAFLLGISIISLFGLLLSDIIRNLMPGASNSWMKSQTTAEPAPAPAVAERVPPLEIKPGCKSQLEAAGWLNYVTENLDVIEYFPYLALTGKNGEEFIGQAFFKDGKRYALVSTKQSSLELCRDIVHEANHHKAMREYGSWSSQADARNAEDAFEHDLDKARRNGGKR